MKTRQNFVHLHIYSDNSLFLSTASVEALVDRAEELGMKHLALTDYSTMFGIMEFIASAIANGFEEKKAAAIFDTLVQSAACAFLKSHSVSYTIIAYQTAYLKANFPEEFNIACNGDS